ncbi:MAG: hypothetical protein ABR964_00455 [Tepidisphaeraceae bacterium]|jgi:hypothetical protein
MNTPFHLHAQQVSADSQVEPSDGLPAEVSGQPATYFWKEVIHIGNYVHPTRGYSLNVDADRLQSWAETGTEMLAAGVPIPINCDHSDRARDVVGYVKQFKLDGDRLLALCQFIGPDAALTAARNWVSVGIHPDFTDGQARQWGEAIVHLALTPVPVVPNQGQVVSASRDADGGDTLVLLQTLAENEEVSPSADVHGDLESQLAAAQQRIAELSARLPPALSDEAQQAMVEAAIAKFDAAVAGGGLSPAARDRLVATLVKNENGSANVLALSRLSNPQGDRCLALSIAEILLDNRPINTGEKTGLQSMARVAPGEESSAIEQLRQYMTKVASVTG